MCSVPRHWQTHRQTVGQVEVHGQASLFTLMYRYIRFSRSNHECAHRDWQTNRHTSDLYPILYIMRKIRYPKKHICTIMSEKTWPYISSRRKNPRDWQTKRQPVGQVESIWGGKYAIVDFNAPIKYFAF